MTFTAWIRRKWWKLALAVVVPAVGCYILTVCISTWMFSLVWIGSANVTVDWNQMPIEAGGGARGVAGSFFKEALSDPNYDWSGLYWNASDAVREGRISRGTGSSDVVIIPKRDADKVRFLILTVTAEKERAMVLATDARATFSHMFQSYRVAEGFANLVGESRSDRGSQNDIGFLLRLASMVEAQPVQAQDPPHVASAGGIGFLVGALVGLPVALVAALCGPLLYVLLSFLFGSLRRK